MFPYNTTSASDERRSQQASIKKRGRSPYNSSRKRLFDGAGSDDALVTPITLSDTFAIPTSRPSSSEKCESSPHSLMELASLEEENTNNSFYTDVANTSTTSANMTPNATQSGLNSSVLSSAGASTPPYQTSTPIASRHEPPIRIRISPPTTPQRTPKICPPTPSPLRSVSRSPHLKKIKIPDFDDSTSESKPTQGLLERRHLEVAHMFANHIEEANDEEFTSVPKITCSSPPSTPPSSPPSGPIAFGSYLHPPPNNTNPFSPEKPRLRPQFIHVEEYSPVASATPQLNNCFSRYTSEFIEDELIGSGCFGSVYKCKNRIDGWPYAIKISKKKMRRESERKNLMKEAYALAALGTHPNVLRYYGSWIEDEQLYIQTEFCGGGSIGCLFQNGAVFNEAQLCNILRQVAMGLEHIHGKNFVHLDIKPENIYISPSLDLYKIGDFGLLCNADTQDFEEGDCRYLPREVLGAVSHTTDLTKADIFSLGCSIYELAIRKVLPPRGEEWAEIRDGIISLPPSFSKDFEALLKQMMHPDFSLRPSAKELVEHPLLRTPEERKKEKDKLKRRQLKQQLERKEFELLQAQKELELFRKNEVEVNDHKETTRKLEAILYAFLTRQPELQTILDQHQISPSTTKN